VISHVIDPVMDSACRMARIRLTSEEFILRRNHTPGGYMALAADLRAALKRLPSLPLLRTTRLLPR
jgi:hypothetical protein